MGQPVLKMYQMRYKEAWFTLTRQEQAVILEKVNEALKKVGGSHVTTCLSLWSSERWMGFGVERFPDIEAVLLHTQMLYDIGWYRYVEADSQLGIETNF